MALARRIVSGDEEDEAETVEEVLTRAQDVESEAGELRVGEDGGGWRRRSRGPQRSTERPPRGQVYGATADAAVLSGEGQRA